MNNTNSKNYITIVSNSLRQFKENYKAERKLTDGVLTSRVIGEFSVGKTRVLKELLSDLIPEKLYPISALQRETRLQLEITYGDSAELTLIEKPNDINQGKVIKKLDTFPSREQSLSYDPNIYRLRLSLPCEYFILNGDGYSDDKDPKRLFIIDMPGWNSGDDDIAEKSATEMFLGEHILSLVYVSHAARVDSIDNAERLEEFLVAMDDSAFLVDIPKLLFVVTCCPDNKQQFFLQRAKELVYKIWTDKLNNDADKLELDVFCVDFATINKTELIKFREAFWQSLLSPLSEEMRAKSQQKTLNWLQNIDTNKVDLKIKEMIIDSYNVINNAQNLLDKAMQQGEFIFGMNKHRLIGLNLYEIKSKIKATWYKQIEFSIDNVSQIIDKKLSSNFSINIDDEGPLYYYWKNYWNDKLSNIISSVTKFFNTAENVLNNLNETHIENLNDVVFSKLYDSYESCLMKFHNNPFIELVNVLHNLINGNHNQQKSTLVATLFTLSLLESGCNK